jgi:3-oxoacyl-[acyl-carrier protein] reductase
MSYEIGMRPGDDLAGKVALITGGARNIGRAISRSLAAGGATVMINANTSREAGEETVAMIQKAGGKAALCMGDVTDPDAVKHLVDETIKQFGRIDMLVSNAAIRAETPLKKFRLRNGGA